ncbi:hypothetical protein FGO68_gene13767 [Halteria grandinella]|uniref:AIG1-type G domain-containing protein n=1 Tax=Halteria grandinella TaxID=5974 RepID=A0A8J8NZD4_HALGN|nr:hypothetical protein FGO68_gene13767 [Halteria grandinella]
MGSLYSEFHYETGNTVSQEKCAQLLSQNGYNLREALIQHYSGSSYSSNSKDDQGKQWVILGNTRAGKSTFINTMTGTQSAEVGKGFGQSTTSSSKAYTAILPTGQEVSLIDNAGFNDSRAISNSDIKDGIFKAIVKGNSKNTIDAVLLFQSCQTDFFSFQDLAKKAKQIFGPSIRNQLVVVFTKHVKNPEFAKEGMMECKKLGLRSFLWESVDISPYSMHRQKSSLQEFLFTKYPYRVWEAFSFMRKVAEKALSKQAMAPRLVKSKTKYFTETIQEVQTVTEYKTITQTVYREEARGGLAGFFGGTRTVTDYVTSQIPIQRQILVPKEVTRSRVEHQYIMPPLHQFIAPAKRELLQKLY